MSRWSIYFPKFCLKSTMRTIIARRGSKGRSSNSPAGMEAAHSIIDRVCDDTRASDIIGNVKRGSQREQKKRCRMALPLIFLIDGELAKQRDRYEFRAVALLRFWKKGSLDLCRAQGDVADNAPRGSIGDHVDARGAVDVIRPGTPPKPVIERLSTAIERGPLIRLGERARWCRGRQCYRCQVGVTRLSFLRA